MKKLTNSLLASTWILSLSSLVTKILSAFYRVPLQNIVGDRGFFVYQQVYPLYGLCTAIALTGFPLFVSQIIAEDPLQQRHNFKKLFWLATLLGLGSSFLLMFGAFVLARIMGDLHLVPLIQILAAFCLIAPFEALLRGSFQGKLQMLPTALSQVSEQLLRVVLIIIVALLFRQAHFSVYEMGTWAHGAAFGGGLLGLAVLLLFLPQLKLTPTANQRKTKIWRRFWNEGVLLSLFGSLLILLQLVDSLTLLKLLRHLPIKHPELVKGVYDRGQPLAQLGIVIAVSFATTLLPQISGKHNAQKEKLIVNTLHIAISLATACACGMAALMPQINTLLFKNSAQSLALALYVLALSFISYATIMNTIMQAQHQQQKNWLALIVALISKWLLNILLVPIFGVSGASWSTLLASIILAIIVHHNAPAYLRGTLVQNKFIYKLVAVMLVMILAVAVLGLLFRLGGSLNRIRALGETAIGIVLGVSTMLFYSYRWDLWTPEEWQLIPGHRLILKKLGEWNAIR